MTTKIAFVLAALLGLGMIFIGGRFLLAPQTAVAGFGLHFDPLSDTSFYYTKGIRDIFSGLVLCALAVRRDRISLGIVLLCGALIPVVDMTIVLSKTYTTIANAMPHISAIIICLGIGLTLLFSQPSAVLPSPSEQGRR
jgi:hypothetical protein